MAHLERIFGKFKTTKGSGVDGIADYFLKIYLPAIAESLCDIFDYYRLSKNRFTKDFPIVISVI